MEEHLGGERGGEGGAFGWREEAGGEKQSSLWPQPLTCTLSKGEWSMLSQEIFISIIYMQHCFRSSLIINIFALLVKWGKMSITNAPKSDETSKVYSANPKYLIGQNLLQVYVKTGVH